MEQQSGTCPVCDDSASIDSSNKDTLKVECRMCGKFEITIEALKLFNESSTHSKIILFQEWVSSNQGKIVDERLVEILVAPYPLPSILSVLDDLCLWLGSKLKELNSSIDISSLELLGIIKVHSEEELLYVLQQFSQMGYIGYTYEDRIRGIESITLSMKFLGWQNYEQLSLVSGSNNKAFISKSIANEKNIKIFNEVIKPAVQESGFKLYDFEYGARDGNINNLIRDDILNAKFVIADLFSESNRTYWEIGFAEALEKPIFFICEKELFDEVKNRDKYNQDDFEFNHIQILLFEKNKLNEFKDLLKATIRKSFITGCELDSPE